MNIIKNYDLIVSIINNSFCINDCDPELGYYLIDKAKDFTIQELSKKDTKSISKLLDIINVEVSYDIICIMDVFKEIKQIIKEYTVGDEELLYYTYKDYISYGLCTFIDDICRRKTLNPSKVKKVFYDFVKDYKLSERIFEDFMYWWGIDYDGHVKRVYAVNKFIEYLSNLYEKINKTVD